MMIIEFRFKSTEEVKRYVTTTPAVKLYGIKHGGERPIRCDIYEADNSPWSYSPLTEVGEAQLKDLFYKGIAKAMHPLSKDIRIHSKYLESILRFEELRKL